MAYGFTLGPTAGYDLNIIKLVGYCWVAPTKAMEALAGCTMAKGMPYGLPDLVAVAPYKLNYLGNVDTMAAAWRARAPRCWTSGR